jgi:carboxypeptidase T
MKTLKNIGVIAVMLMAIPLTVTATTPSHYWMKFTANSKEQRSQIANLGVAIEGIVDDSVFAIGTENNLIAAKNSGLLVTSFLLTAQMRDFPPEDSKFHDFNRLTQELQKMASQYPKLVTLSTIGKSLEGRDQWLITLSTDGKDQTRPAVFFMGGHHAREHVSIETPLQLAQYLAAEYTKGTERIVTLLNSRTVYIVPNVNPDGTEFDVGTGEYQYWRKNRSHNADGSSGVDLNRNYGYHWGEGGASDDPNDETYHGPSAFSEPETQNLKAFFESHKNIAVDLSFHTFSELILYPWGHTYENISDDRAFRAHKTMAETMAKWNGYTPEQSSALYITSGDTTDWAYGQLGIFSFTFELDPSSSAGEGGFYPGQDSIVPVFQKNLEPCLYLIGLADNPYKVLDSTSETYGLSRGILK